MKYSRLLFIIMSLGLIMACDKEDNAGLELGEEKVIHVTGVTLNQKQVTMKEGESVTLIPTIYPENATNQKVSWSSADVTIAVVDEGKVTAIKAGTTSIVVTTEDGGKTAICSIVIESNLAPVVTVGVEHVSAVSVVLKGKANLGSTMSSDLKIGFQYSKSAGIMPSNSTMVDAEDADANYNYTTAITGLEPDTKYYFRSFVRQNGQDTYGETKEFTTNDVASLLETQDATEIEAASACLNAKLDMTDVKYSSKSYGFYFGTSKTAQDTKINGGEIENNAYSALSTGLSHKTQYWYRAFVILDNQTFYGEVKTFTTDVVPVESVSLGQEEYFIHTIGNTLTLEATVLPAEATNKAVIWTSDNEAVASVSSSGTVEAIDNGTATITVTTTDGEKTAACTITVAQWITDITLDKTTITLNEGQEQILTPTVNPATAVDKSLTYTSSDTSVATVDPEGKVTAVSKGTATIKATANDGSVNYATCPVTVIRPVTSIELNKSSLVLYRGTSNVTETLYATVKPSSASNTAVTWTSSNTSVAMVSSSGVVTGKARGTATIMVTSNDGNGVQAICEVEVRQYVTSTTLDRTMWPLVIGDEASISVSVFPDNANDMSVTWSSSDNTIASVDNSGTVTAKAKGKATIKATANDGSGVFAYCSVVVRKNPCPAGAVDLGLSVYWATSNLGASKPEAYGDYYAWGETVTKEKYSWLAYKWGISSTNLTKYNTDSSCGSVDNNTVLDPEDDVASINLGGSWHMPTYEEWTELIEQCTWAWSKQNGVEGSLVTGSNGNNIFLPAAGYQYYYSTNEEGYGCYWSSSLVTDRPYRAYTVSFGSDGYVDRRSYYRCFGQSVRPVSE